MFTSPIITADELRASRESASRPALVVCDVRAYLDGRSGREAFESGHIEGARFIDLDTVLAAPPGPIVGRHPLPTPEVFAAGLAAAGIGHDNPVVAYDDAGGMIAGRLVWMLRILGQPAALLDGGIDAWDEPLVTDQQPIEIVPNQARSWPSQAIVDADDVAAIIADGGMVVDSRAPARFRGEQEPIDPRAGHIPGAVNLPFADNLHGGSFRPAPERSERFASAGIDENTVWYCGSGVSACNNMLAAEAAGFGLGRLYVGSWSGWSSDPERPAETG